MNKIRKNEFKVKTLKRCRTLLNTKATSNIDIQPLNHLEKKGCLYIEHLNISAVQKGGKKNPQRHKGYFKKDAQFLPPPAPP